MIIISHLQASEGDAYIEGKPGTLRPFRILISLLDKPEIGSSILEDVLIDIFRYMYKECETTEPTDIMSEDSSGTHHSFNTSQKTYANPDFPSSDEWRGLQLIHNEGLTVKDIYRNVSLKLRKHSNFVFDTEKSFILNQTTLHLQGDHLFYQCL